MNLLLVLIPVTDKFGGDVRGTVVACWTVCQQVERAILYQMHDSQENSSYSPRLSPAQYSYTVQNRGLKHHSFYTSLAVVLSTALLIFIFTGNYTTDPICSSCAFCNVASIFIFAESLQWDLPY